MILYHWSPSSRREAIERDGFRPGSESTDGLWRPPYTCWADSPSLAWGLSGAMPRGEQHPTWDLWMLHDDRLDGYEVLYFDTGDEDPADEPRMKEARVYYPIPADDVWYVGTRERTEPS